MKAVMDLHPDEAWAALMAKDNRYDGTFVYAVASTNIYCRPVCPSKRPARRNVSFFLTPAEAEHAGYRPCLRCHPDRDRPSVAEATVDRARRYLDQHLDERVTLERLGQAVDASPFHLQRTFKRLLGISPREYVQMRRADRFKGELREGRTVARATYEAGYGSSSRVYERSDAQLGMTPGAYRRGGESQQIRYTIADCTLGKLLVAATDRGVTAVALGDTEQDLRAHLHREYPRADIERSDDTLANWVTTIVDYVDGATTEMTVPLDVQGTLFQYQVWKALQEIPYGSTRTYSDVAQAIGKPTATRAVARACATNPAALVIPCHRVIRRDGGLGGYRWGRARKASLLEMEAAE